MSARAQVLVAVLSVATSAFGGPAESVAAALADAKKQPVEIRSSLRYLSLWSVPEKERETFAKVLAFQCNSLSREADLVLPAKVNAELLRINLLDYGWTRDVWEKLASSDPYYHVGLEKVKVVAPAIEVVPEFKEERVSFDGGRTWQTRRVRVGEKKVAKPEAKATAVAHAPWLPTQEITALALALNSDAPVLRADWFLFWTAIQKGRKGAGYYDFLAFKKRDDLQKAVALDIEAARRVRKEMAAIVSESGVALNNRQVVRFQTLTGGYWATLDVEDSEGQRNAVRVLNGDYVHDAEEIYGTLPNGLFAFAAAAANGDLQETVPDNIAGDHASTSNDRRIHVGLSCVRCHEEGLRPIDDWARKVYRGPVTLTSPDYLKLKRLRQLYLSDLPGQLRLDQEAYARTLKALNGLTPKANAQAYALAWRAYAEVSLGLEETAYELGVEPKVWRAALEGYARAGNADPVLAGLLADPPAKIRREHWHEVYPLAQTIIRSKP